MARLLGSIGRIDKIGSPMSSVQPVTDLATVFIRLMRKPLLSLSLRFGLFRLLLIPALTTVLITPTALAEQVDTSEALSLQFPDVDQAKNGRFTLFIDNDVTRGKDEDYSSGLRWSWISRDIASPDRLPLIPRALHHLTGFDSEGGFLESLWGLDHTSPIRYHYGVAATHLIFTPDTIRAPRPADERPYAGWFGLGFSLHATDGDVLNSFEVSIGTVGPNARAQEAQDFVHELIEDPLFEGWDSQVPNELTFNLALSQIRRYDHLATGDLPWFPLGVNSFSEVELNLGNQLTSAALGWHLRFGYRPSKQFTHFRVSPTASTIPTSAEDSPARARAYLIAGVKGHAVLHDITLDGTVFRDFDTGVSSEPFVFETYYGIGLHYKQIDLSFTNTIRTAAFEGQNGIHEYGSLIFRFRY